MALAMAACTWGRLGHPATPRMRRQRSWPRRSRPRASPLRRRPSTRRVHRPHPLPPTVTATAKPQVKINANGAACRSGPEREQRDPDDPGRRHNGGYDRQGHGRWLLDGQGSRKRQFVLGADAGRHRQRQLCAAARGDTAGHGVAALDARRARLSANFNYWEYNCGGGTVSLQWLDNADNETGYRIYRNGQMIAELPAGSTSYTDAIYLGIGPLHYSIRAYNDAGESAPLNTPGLFLLSKSPVIWKQEGRGSSCLGLVIYRRDATPPALPWSSWFACRAHRCSGCACGCGRTAA